MKVREHGKWKWDLGALRLGHGVAWLHLDFPMEGGERGDG